MYIGASLAGQTTGGHFDIHISDLILGCVSHELVTAVMTNSNQSLGLKMLNVTEVPCSGSLNRVYHFLLRLDADHGSSQKV